MAREPIKAYAYLRVSGDAQIEGDGFPRQREAILRMAERCGLEIVGEYRDEGISGAFEHSDRPAMTQMINDMRGNGVKAFVVEELRRLARGLLVQEHALVYLAGEGLDVWSADTSENVTAAIREDPAKKANIQMRGVFGEWEKAGIVQRLRDSRRRKREATGRCEGQKPYGHYPQEKWGLYALGVMRDCLPRISAREAAEALTALGVPTRAQTLLALAERRGREPGAALRRQAQRGWSRASVARLWRQASTA